jgi:UDP-hydrolysing UDP-N-acetyl-D-glucosamine 2-epimerase
MNIGFISGARSDYGPFKEVLKGLDSNNAYNLSIIVHGLHFLKEFGRTVNEIYLDNFDNIVEIETFIPLSKKVDEFNITLDKIYNHIFINKYDLLILVGDRPETYAAALAAHFAKVPILHSGGGHITAGAIDNIYRYNITNLANYHLTTSEKAFETLKALPTIDKDKVFFVGSPSVDAIKSFLHSPKNITEYIPELNTKYVLMTFHPVTAINENIVNIMKKSVDMILNNKIDILITYPNNDEKSVEIISFIKKLQLNESVHSFAHLGSNAYYAAIYNCELVIGNSSSGIMEAPYFNKTVINIGDRQNGRSMDKSIINVSDEQEILKALSNNLKKNLVINSCEELYGKGDSVFKSLKIVKKILNQLNVNR